MASKMWREGRNAIVVYLGRGTTSPTRASRGPACCGSTVGGGRVATNRDHEQTEHPIQDSTPYNHYSLLLSFEDAFRLPCLAGRVRRRARREADDAAVPPQGLDGTRAF